MIARILVSRINEFIACRSSRSFEHITQKRRADQDDAKTYGVWAEVRDAHMGQSRASGTTAVQQAILSVASSDPESHGEGLACRTGHHRGSVQQALAD